MVVDFVSEEFRYIPVSVTVERQVGEEFIEVTLIETFARESVFVRAPTVGALGEEKEAKKRSLQV
ncbi:MAG: hypothetical protein COB62_04065 [Piscirickettsiaceae bacterium]|nr:MAG: hypothetical protein COB62_04065 [Piscirickettsiaceae bacterium]